MAARPYGWGTYTAVLLPKPSSEIEVEFVRVPTLFHALQAEDALDRLVVVRGKATNSARGPQVSFDDGSHIDLPGLERWPKHTVHSYVTVSGTLREHKKSLLLEQAKLHQRAFRR